MRHCIIGNSHTVAYRLAWERIADDHPQSSIRAFVAPGDQLRLRWADGTLGAADPETEEWMAERSGGVRRINPQEYDRFWVIGMGLGINQATNLSLHVSPHSSLGRQALTTPQSFRTLLRSILNRTLAARTFRTLRQHVDPDKIFFVPEPAPVHKSLAASPRLAELAEPPVSEQIREDFSVVVTQMVATLGAAAFCPQVDSTLQTPLTSFDQYHRASFEDPSDMVHLNDKYGQLMLEKHILQATQR